MIRRILTIVLGLTLRVFFRRIEVAGIERVPPEGAAIFVLNHPNALVDPVFLLCLAPRDVSFLAKSTIFKMPVLGYLARALDAIPVYRRQDEGEDMTKNRETFEHSHALLARGGTIGICPEGVSHNESSLRPLKTGTARIALGAASTGEALDLNIVPAGVYYTAKTTFRSAALLYFGEPFKVEPVELGSNGELPREAVQKLSERIAQTLREVTLNAEHHEGLQTIARAERIFSAEDESIEGEPSLERELRLRRRFVEAYAFLYSRVPERIAALESRILRYEEELKQAGFDDPRLLSPSTISKHASIARLMMSVVVFVLLAPVALAGVALHYPAYRLAGFFARKFSQESDDVVSTIKIIAAMLLFPLTWLAVAAFLWVWVDWWLGVLAFFLTPIVGYAALRFLEEFDRFIGGTRSLVFFITERRFFRHLLSERRAIRREILSLAEEAARPGGKIRPV